jgi:hypothetical protein
MEKLEDFIFDSQVLTEEEKIALFRENKDEMDLKRVFINKTNIPPILVEESIDEVGANLVAKTQEISEQYIRDNLEKFNAERLVEGQDVPEDILQEQIEQGKLKMEKAIKNKVFSMEFLRNNLQNLDWFSV